MINQEALSASEKHKLINAASREKNPLEKMPVDCFNFKSKTSEQFKLYCRTKGDMDSKTLKWAFKLAEKNVGPFYKETKMGWQPKMKQAELNKNWARYLVALNQENQPVAFSMFRFDMDNDECVLYCYEIQIMPEYHRKGIGKHIMESLEMCAKYFKLQKVILTVLNNNLNTQAFFTALGYVKDETSPDILERADYQILSKATFRDDD